MAKYAPGDGGIPTKSTYKGGTAAACGTAGAAITVPSGSSWAIISAEGGVIYFQINGTAVGTAVPGYCPSEGQTLIPSIDNLTTLYVTGATSSVAHVAFYQD